MADKFRFSVNYMKVSLKIVKISNVKKVYHSLEVHDYKRIHSNLVKVYYF